MGVRLTNTVHLGSPVPHEDGASGFQINEKAVLLCLRCDC